MNFTDIICHKKYQVELKLHTVFTALQFLLFVSVLPLTIGDLNSDKQALLDFAAVVPHGREFNWNATTTICTSWEGISYNTTTPTATPPTDDTNTESRKTAKKTTAAIAAEVADKLASSTSSQYIMSSVLSTFAAEEAKSVGLAQTSTVSNNFTNSMPGPALPVSDPNAFMQTQPQPLSVQPHNLYQSVPHNMQNAQYQIIQNLSPQQYMQQNSTGIIMSPYGYATPPFPPGPPPPRPPHMMGQMMPLNQQQMQVSQPQPISVVTGA